MDMITQQKLEWMRVHVDVRNDIDAARKSLAQLKLIPLLEGEDHVARHEIADLLKKLDAARTAIQRAENALIDGAE